MMNLQVTWGLGHICCECLPTWGPPPFRCTAALNPLLSCAIQCTPTQPPQALFSAQQPSPTSTHSPAPTTHTHSHPCPTSTTRPLLKVGPTPLGGGGGGSWLVGGWVGGQKRVCVPKIDLQFRAPLINIILFRRKCCLTWAGGWVPWSSGSPKMTPSPKSVSKGLSSNPHPVQPASGHQVQHEHPRERHTGGQHPPAVPDRSLQSAELLPRIHCRHVPGGHDCGAHAVQW